MVSSPDEMALPPEKKSRSQVKREFRELKDLGVRLAALSEQQLATLPLAEDTREAILVARGLKRGALQRQYRYISSLLAQEDVEAVRLALAAVLRPQVKDVANLHAAERWRDRLLGADEAELAELAQQFPESERERLRSLVSAATKERALGKPPTSARQLFRLLRQLSDLG